MNEEFNRYLEILYLHAASMLVDGEAILFIAPSGTGKSTTCEMLRDYAQLFAEDKVYLGQSVEGEWLVADATDSDLTQVLSYARAKTLDWAPLKAIFRLYRDSEAQVMRLDPLETAHLVTIAFFELILNRLNYGLNSNELVFSKISDIARKVPGYRLRFNLTEQTTTVIRQELAIISGSTQICG